MVGELPAEDEVEDVVVMDVDVLHVFVMVVDVFSVVLKDVVKGSAVIVLIPQY